MYLDDALAETLVAVPEEALPPDWADLSDRERMDWYGRYATRNGPRTGDDGGTFRRRFRRG